MNEMIDEMIRRFIEQQQRALDNLFFIIFGLLALIIIGGIATYYLKK